MKISAGQKLNYRLSDSGKNWERDVINGLDEVRQTVQFGHIEVPIAEITYLRLPQRSWLQIVGAQLAVFGISWVGASAIGDWAYNDKNINWTTAGVIGLTTVPAGILLMRDRKVKMGGRHRLRVLDLTYPGTEQGQRTE
ncbi:MAG: hypothetical protein IPL65_04955 [Lewinellaceae bacterium]|nr:hypothetical protein [Lewinellaceae bacterium]